MEEQLIEFKTAKLAKEKRFNLISHTWYNPLGSLYENQSGFSDNTGSQRITVVTQSLLQKWLREKHNLFILMQVGGFIDDKQTFYCNVFEFGKNLYKGKFRSKRCVYTFEQALEEGLYQALKLIENN